MGQLASQARRARAIEPRWDVRRRSGLLLIAVMTLALAACDAQTPPATAVTQSPAATPSAGPTLISADTAVAQAIAAAQAGGPYTRLDGAPTEIRAGLDQTSPPRWIVVLRGRVVETVPASAGGDVPEREEILHQLVITVDAQTAEVIELKAFSPDHEMDASAYPLRALPAGPVATPPPRPAPPATDVPLPTRVPAPTPAPTATPGPAPTLLVQALPTLPGGPLLTPEQVLGQVLQIDRQMATWEHPWSVDTLKSDPSRFTIQWFPTRTDESGQAGTYAQEPGRGCGAGLEGQHPGPRSR